ncbi:CopG family ribbon-helix-helix protein [Pseudomonas sp. 18058]|jgi:predicted transcriptional regulator|uniref:CopG family ribbon-helix-helix protein n=1 Tax=Pseudomonas sp. 18058 TaxID=2681406 RepID=UPI001357E74E|nr:ribbon-helix-helix domain-containing protein [Pseudomonas sp. 18058]
MPVISLHLPDEIADALTDLAKATGRSKSSLANDALSEYLERETWKTEQIQQAIIEADAGDFASAAAVETITAKWSGNTR